MNISIREYIKKNFEDCTLEELKESIEDSVQSDDEVVLPGMGVLFEILWKYSNKKDSILEILHNNLK